MSTLTAKIFNSLKEATDDQERFEILDKYSYDLLVKTTISYIYNPMIDFGLEDFKPQQTGKLHGMGLSKFMNIPQEILELKLTSEESAYKCNLALQHINDEEADIFINIVTKNPAYGLTKELINDVWPGLIPNHILSYPTEYTADKEITIDFPCAIQKISNGLRVYIIVRGNSVEFRNKHGELIKQFNTYAHQFSKLAQNGNVVFHGHAVKVDDDMNKLTASDEEILATDEDHTKFILWDVVKYEGFVKGLDNHLGYNWRYNGLEHMMYLAVESNPTPCYAPVVQAVVGDIKQVMDFAERMNGGIVKNFSGAWCSGSNPDELLIFPQTET